MRVNYLLHIIFVFSFSIASGQLHLSVKNDEVLQKMTPGKQHTIVLQLENKTNNTLFAQTALNIAAQWDIISNGFKGDITTNQKKMVFISVYVPATTPPGLVEGKVVVLDKQNTIVAEVALQFNVPEVHQLEVQQLSSPTIVMAGETITSTFQINNKGNVAEEVVILTGASEEKKEHRVIEVDSSAVITVKRATDKRYQKVRQENVFLKVYREDAPEDVKRGYAMTTVYPVKMASEDAYFRYPVEASLYYNVFNAHDYQYNSFLVEAKGEGYLDTRKKQYLDFIVRSPNQNTINRFGMNDQYTFQYTYNKEFNVIVGDYSYRANRLGFISRYGFGFKANYTVKDWDVTAFYSSPRLSRIYTESLLGVKVLKQLSNTFNIGVSVSQSKENIWQYDAEIPNRSKETGQILVVESNYKNKGTLVEHESSVSFMPEHMATAHDTRIHHKKKNFTYNGNFTITGQNYFGTMRNSLRYANSFRYYKNKWSVGVGQGLSKINRKYNPDYELPEPFYETYFLSAGYKISQKQHTNIRVSNILREDRQEVKTFYYKEYGLDYTYRYMYGGLSLSFNGRLAKTQNLLSNEQVYRTTYANNISGAYQINSTFGLRANLNQNYTNRYGVSGLATNYYNYGVGANINLKGRMQLSAMYNSGFSPEEDYLQRDFITLNFGARVKRAHKFSARLNYYENALSSNDREWFSFLKYTYFFGAPLKRVKWQGAIQGEVKTTNASISVEKIKVKASSEEGFTNAFGHFNLKNLSKGSNFVWIDESSLPQGIVVRQKMPMEVVVNEGKTTRVVLDVMKAAALKGQFKIEETTKGEKAISLEGYLKIEGEGHTYYTESKEDGSFEVKGMVPGDYRVSIISLKNEKEFKKLTSEPHIRLVEEQEQFIEIALHKKARAIQFKQSNFSISM